MTGLALAGNGELNDATWPSRPGSLPCTRVQRCGPLFRDRYRDPEEPRYPDHRHSDRYVDGLGTWAPQDPGIYRERAARIVEHGYTGVTQAAMATLHR